jgi:hypothetical protein
MGVGLLEADLGLEPVGIDQQQHQVGLAGEPVVRHRGMLRCRGAADDAVAMERPGGVGPSVGGALPVPCGGDVEEDAHGCRPETLSSITSWQGARMSHR